jgi:intracellular multiplication protein IcmJ
MNMLHLVLSVKRSKWRAHDRHAEPANSAYREIRPKVLEAQGYRCQFCGFTAKDTQIHHLDDDHANNKCENLVTADPLCHAGPHIGLVGCKNGGVLAAVGGVSQENLNHLLRTIYIVLETGTEEEKARAERLLVHLTDLKSEVAQVLGTYRPIDLADAMLGMTDEEFENREHLLGGVRLVLKPEFLRPPSQPVDYIKRWVPLYQALPIASWERIRDRLCGVHTER